jgi:hypothetical protein
MIVRNRSLRASDSRPGIPYPESRHVSASNAVCCVPGVHVTTRFVSEQFRLAKDYTVPEGPAWMPQFLRLSQELSSLSRFSLFAKRGF